MTRRKALFVEGPDVWVILPPESEVPFLLLRIRGSHSACCLHGMH